MNSNRRSFIRLGSLALGASCLLRPRTLFAFGADKGVLSFNAAEMRLLDFVASYSSAARVIGASVLGRMHSDSRCGMHLFVETRDFVRLAGALLNAPFPNIFANANRISFSSSGRANVIENLSSEDFAARLAGLGGNDVVFGHDAIVYDPAAKTLDDPFGAIDSGELKLLNRPTQTPVALEAVVRGTAEAHAAGIAEGREFTQWKSQVTKLTAHSSAAEPIAAAFVKTLPALAALAGTDQVKSMVATPLVSSAIKAALGMTGTSAVGEFDRVRAIFGQLYSDGAVWLYVLLAKQMKTNMPAWIAPDFSEDAHWHEAFTNAVLIQAAFESPELKSQA